MNPKVSILIPTYNRANLIHRAIESSLNQTYKCEVIVCDHGSNDGTFELCLSYGNRINYIRREKDLGIHFCELESILSSTGEFIHFCFDDDWMHPKFIQKCIELLDKDTGIVYSSHEVVELKTCNQSHYNWNSSNPIKAKKILSIKKIPFVLRYLISPSCALVRKEDAIKCIYMTTNLVSDSFYNGVGPDWLITAMPLFKYKYCGYIETPLVKFGAHEKSITTDVDNSEDPIKMRKFRSAYTGARIYMLVSWFVRFIKLETIYFTIEESLRFLIRKARRNDNIQKN